VVEVRWSALAICACPTSHVGDADETFRYVVKKDDISPRDRRPSHNPASL
jgi:hypothetical protein